jgi:tRNA nucleotidyltransferase (CCA-adding enzyme)
MSRDWATTFEAWGSPPSEAEETERRRTETEIDSALRAHRPLQDKRISVYAKGSYRRGTNVRRGSDIDIAVELRGDQATGESFITEKLFEANGLTDADLGLVSVG